MKKLKTKLILVATLILLMGSLSRCGVPDYNMMILGTLIPSDECVFEAPSSNSIFRASGALDISFLLSNPNLSYVIGLGIENRIYNFDATQTGSARTGQAGLMINTRDVILKEFEVTITGAQNSLYGTNVGPYKVDYAGRLLPSKIQLGGEATPIAIAGEIIPASIVELIASDPAVGAPGDAADILVKVIVHGETSDGGDISSNEYQFPITVCNGCLNGFPGNDISNCPLNSWITQDVEDAKFGTCLPGQDSISGKSVVYCICDSDSVYNQTTNACVSSK